MIETNLSFAFFIQRNSAADLRDLIDRGLIAVAQNDFQTAFGFFENALKLEPTNTMVDAVISLSHFLITSSFFSYSITWASANFTLAV